MGVLVIAVFTLTGDLSLWLFVVLKSYIIFLECIWILFTPGILHQLLPHPSSQSLATTHKFMVFFFNNLVSYLPDCGEWLSSLCVINCQCSHSGLVMQDCLILWRSDAGSHSCWEFMNEVVLCWEDILICLFPTPGSYNFSDLVFHYSPWAMEGGREGKM